VPSNDLQRSEDRRSAAIGRVRAVAAAAGAAGTVLTRPGPVAWASGGMNPPIDRTAALDTVWVVVSEHRYAVMTTDVEHDRIVAELAPTGVDVVAVPWWDASALARAACAWLDAPARSIASDGHPAFGVDLDHELCRARLALSSAEQDDLRDLGRDAAFAVEEALRVWEPGEPDTAIAARIAAAIERVGADAPVLLVGGDERLARFRHPVANGSRPERTVMAVLVARRGGLHVALSRHATSAPNAALEASLAACRRIHRATLAAGHADATYGDALLALDRTYAVEGADGAWREHYQGGPIGYAQREFEIAPCETSSAWWSEAVAPGVALAWNPSLAGGAKDEDTFLVGAGGSLELVTATGTWPAADDLLPARPAVLRVG
jgi:hypothetical protein